MFEVIIGADIVPTDTNCEMFKNENVNELIGSELVDVLSNVEYRVFNLEVPLYDGNSPIVKAGPNLIAPTYTVNAMKAMQIDLFTLANNHIMDHGIDGLYSTMEVLDGAGICYVGAGRNLDDLEQYKIVEKDGVKLGIYVCSEHEFSIASAREPGVNPYDPLVTFDHIEELKQKCNYVVVLYHGMKEYYRLPTPKLQKHLRKMIQKGADLVICQHNHCIGCEEEYLGGKIIYGQGNFLFDRGDDEFWNSGLLIKILFDNGKVSLDYIPIVKKGNMVRLASQTEKKQILYEYYNRSELAKDEEYIVEQYNEFIKQYEELYLRSFAGWFANNIIFKIINIIFKRKFIYKFYQKRHLVNIKNYIECEAHYEAVLAMLNNKIKS